MREIVLATLLLYILVAIAGITYITLDAFYALLNYLSEVLP